MFTGSGKSQLILHLKELLEMRCQENDDFNYKAASFTGLSAHNISAETIHACFRAPVFKPLNQQAWEDHLRKTVDARMKQKFANVRIVLLDEYQMIGKDLFAYINAFLRSVDPSRAEQPFASRSIILAGESLQNISQE